MEWGGMLQALITSGVVAGVLGAVLNKSTERAVDHAFDRRIKDYEAKLAVATAAWTELQKVRQEKYRTLAQLVSLAGRHALDLAEHSAAPPREVELALIEANKLEETLAELIGELTEDGMYDRVHKYKGALKVLLQQLNNEAHHRRSDHVERADSARSEVNRLAEEVRRERVPISRKLSELIRPRGASNLDPNS